MLLQTGPLQAVESSSEGGFLTTSRNGYICHATGLINSRGIYYGDDPLDYSIPSLMLQLCLISIITRATYILLRPFGQPSIVSQILGGVILGPSVLGRNSDFLNKVFPTRGRAVLDTLSVFGLMLFIFLLGVKMDLATAFKSGRKPIAIGLFGFVIPISLAGLVAFLLNHFIPMDRDVSRILPVVVELNSLSTFPVIACLLSELNILNSDIGRLASSSSIVSDVFNWCFLMIKFTAKIATGNSFSSNLGSLLSFVFYIFVVIYGIRPAALWAIRRTPEGKPVKEAYVFLVLVVLLGCGLIGEIMGLSATSASFILGLVIPDGPPLGAAIAEKLDCFVSVLLMPIFFAVCGLQTDVFAIQELKNVGVIQLVVLFAVLGKMIGTVAPPLFFRMPFRDALSLALIMNSKGIIELAILNHLRKGNGMNEECFTIMIISVVVIAGVISPLVKALYDPSRRYIAFKRRTIRHHNRREELRILTCVHNLENVWPIMDLLDASNPTKQSPINLTVLHLVKLIGRSSSLLIADRPREKPSTYPTQSERIFNTFCKLELRNHGLVTVQCFKGVSPYAMMHNDVCSIALEKRSHVIIIPFHRQWIDTRMAEPCYAYRHLNKNVFDKAPCSVGVLIDHGRRQKLHRAVISEPPLHRVVVFFFGGVDDREALAYGMRMSEHPRVALTVLRFSGPCSIEIVGGSERSKILDGEILAEFRLNVLHQPGVSCRDEVLTNPMCLTALIKSLENCCDLILVGRRHRESQYMAELAKWANCMGELGPVGEILAASLVKVTASVLVLQQQNRVWGLHDPEESTHLRSDFLASSSPL